ncbi:methylated-DNA--[protein]-cysteine S-methyltransferase [Leyella stercorea]|uniref:methylated-DNA--[protein]-cysteine S-methyltransferase n=1 Tax=Leyella stercorea TaxID=363265 RepID=UPI003A5C7C91
MMNNRKQVNLQYYDSPCGRLVLASIGDELCLCDWNDMPSAERNMRRLARYTNASFKTETSSVLEETKRQLDEYFAGKRKSFNIRLRLVGTDFQHEAWNALLKIPYGTTMSYKDIAQSIGKPQAVRAVAGAIGANGISILIPCHRVIGCNNSLTGYAGGLEAKKVLLGIETQNK